jgi:hypothetical protein
MMEELVDLNNLMDKNQSEARKASTHKGKVALKTKLNLTT